ncbi:MAG: TrkH family potassium uptake protein, partial [Chthoniobacteraceae bacterium]
AALILIGTLLLLLPRAGAIPDQPISLMDAFFTATSAACVTGLAVRDTGVEFSTLGQVIILVLFQVGGLGIVTFVAFISAFSAKTLPVPQMVAFRQMINAPAMGDLKGRLAGILLLTLIIEGAGALSLFLTLPAGMDGFDRLFWSVFHAVSAFCNAGFSLETTGLEFARGHAGINWTIMLLITLGSLGFLVLPELIGLTLAAMRRLPLLLQRRSRMFLPPLGRRLSVQSRLSIIVTVCLIVIGTVAFWLLEAGHILADRPASENFLVSAFQSITTRTAGFNSVDIGALRQATLLMMMMLMVIGGCPVSTGGGVKTVTIGVLILSLRSMILRKEKVEAFGRTLPARAFFTALNVFVLYSVTAAICVFLLAVFDPEIGLRQTLFETVSALSTVGLSTGITAGLSDPSKLVLCAAMFIGRIGPIALVFSVFEARHKVDYQYPAEDVVVG